MRDEGFMVVVMYILLHEVTESASSCISNLSNFSATVWSMCMRGRVSPAKVTCSSCSLKVSSRLVEEATTVVSSNTSFPTSKPIESLAYTTQVDSNPGLKLRFCNVHKCCVFCNKIWLYRPKLWSIRNCTDGDGEVDGDGDGELNKIN